MKKFDTMLYFITDSSGMEEKKFLEVIESALIGGATLIQLREKEKTTRDYIDFEQGKVIRWIDSDGNILSTPTEETITLPTITTMEGVTTISADTTVKPLISGSY